MFKLGKLVKDGLKQFYVIQIQDKKAQFQVYKIS